MLLTFLDHLGVLTFAASGALAAASRRLDALGVSLVAFVTALGGGTLRDLLLGITPVFWIRQPDHACLALAGGLAAFLLAPRLATAPAWLEPLDALGLGVFTVVGAAVAHAASAPAIAVILLGAVTGVAGGVVRDMLCRRLPFILRGELYATASLAGAGFWLLLARLGAPAPVAAASGVVLVFVLRLAARRWRLSAPLPSPPS